MSRRVYLLGVAVALVALALAVTDWALSLQPGVTEANVKRIRVGMTLAEVETILGEPGVPFSRRRGKPLGSRGGLYLWDGNGVSVWVAAGKDGRVRAVEWKSSGNAQPGLFARLRAWLGW